MQVPKIYCIALFLISHRIKIIFILLIIFLIQIVAGAIEAVSVCVSIFVVLKVGLRRSLIAYMLVPGICCLATNLVPSGDDNQTAVVAMAIIGKLCFGKKTIQIFQHYSNIYVYT